MHYDAILIDEHDNYYDNYSAVYTGQPVNYSALRDASRQRESQLIDDAR